jgi:biopolymer transport protein ExbB/TolQ
MPHESSFVFAFKNLTTEGILTFSVLSLLSLVAWTVIVGKILALRKQQKKADHFYDRFAETTDPLELVGKDDEFEGAPPYSVYDNGIRELQRLRQKFGTAGETNGTVKRLPGKVLARLRAAIERGMSEESGRLSGGMVVLALCISGGPFLGLMGTVIGVMETFAAVGQAGEANFAAIAPGVAGALLNTVLGLFVAIPALFAFNLLQRKIGALESDMGTFASELEGLLMMDYVDVHASALEDDSHSKTMPSSDLSTTH